MVTANPDTCQVVGKKEAKEKVSRIVRYGSEKNLLTKCEARSRHLVSKHLFKSI